ncbi:MAG: fatty acid desaturase family protein [Myxococcota bacterium]
MNAEPTVHGRADRARLEDFAQALDAIRLRVESQLGSTDVEHVLRLRRISRTAELTGRALLFASFEPVSFFGGVAALFLHKQLEAVEIGHTALHGAYDGLPGAEAFHSDTFSWNVPIDEATWRQVHNVRHHGNTNVAGDDPDIHFGAIRLDANTPWSPLHLVQLPLSLFAACMFTFAINYEYSGLNDLLLGNGRADKFDFVEDRSLASWRGAVTKAFRKWVPYYAKNFVAYPLLAGPFFAKVLVGNALAEILRDVYTAATIFCGHVGEDTASFPEGTRAHGRGEWYAMQVEATNNFDVPELVSILCGALDKQIEHHLFPRLPPNRLREIAPEVRAACEAHGVRYRSESWGHTLANVVRRLARLSLPELAPASRARV